MSRGRRHVFGQIVLAAVAMLAVAGVQAQSSASLDDGLIARYTFDDSDLSSSLRCPVARGSLTPVYPQSACAGVSPSAAPADHFAMPVSAVTDLAGHVYVASQTEHFLMRWAPDGKRIGTFGGWYGVPAGMVVDAQGAIYLADRQAATIFKVRHR